MGLGVRQPWAQVDALLLLGSVILNSSTFPELQLPSLQNGGDNTCLVGFLGGLNETPDGDS